MSDDKKVALDAATVKMAEAFKAAGIEIKANKGDTSAPLELAGNGLGVIEAEFAAEGLTLDQAKSAFKVRDRTLAATGMLMEHALPVFKKNKDLERVTLDLPFVTKDKISHIIKRTHETVAPKTEANPNPVPSVKQGHLISSYEVYAGSNGRGELKKVRNYLYERAEAAL